MAFRDLREYIAKLEKEGELKRIEREVDWNLELGAIMRRAYDIGSPAPLFQKIKGFTSAYQVLGAPLGLSKSHRFARLALSMGMRAESTVQDIMDEYVRRKDHPIKPILVSTGPCKENIAIGDEVDLEKFPTPLIHGGDGGRFIGTWHITVTRDPDSEWVNWGMYRMMLHDKKSTGMLISPYQNIGLHYGKYQRKNKPMEVAVAIGTEPVTSTLSAVSFPAGVSEVDMVGAIRGEPVELVRCETIDLTVPATAEIILEGEIHPQERKEEGPFGEFTGYMASERAPRPVFRVKAVTHRNNPILTASCVGYPVDENRVTRVLSNAALMDSLKSAGFPVKMVYCHPEVGILFTVVSTQVPYANYAKHLAGAIWGTPEGRRSHFLAIVEDDVDVTNLSEVMWALTTRCHPDRGIVKATAMTGGPLMPFLNAYERRNNLGASVLFDCTWPKEWPPEAVPVKASFDVLWPQDIQEKVLKNWKEYGYKE